MDTDLHTDIATVAASLPLPPPGTELTTDNIRRALTAVDQHIDAVKSRVQHTLVDDYSAFAEAMTRADRQATDLDALTVDVASLAEVVLDPARGLKGCLTDALSRERQLVAEARRQDEKVVQLRRLQDLRQRLERARYLVNNHSYSEAVDVMDELRTDLAAAPVLSGTRLANAFRDRLDRHRFAVIESLARQFQATVTLTEGDTKGEAGGPVLRVREAPDLPSQQRLPHDGYRVLARLGHLHEQINYFAQRLDDLFINRLCQRECPGWEVVVTGTGDADQGEPVLRLRHQTDTMTTVGSTMATTAVDRPLINLTTLLMFVRDHVFFGQDSGDLGDGDRPMALLGQALIQRDLYPRLIRGHLLDSIPDHKAHFAAFQVTAEQLRHYEDRIVELDFLPGTERPLTDFAANLDVHFITKRRRDALALVERLIARQDYAVVEASAGPSMQDAMLDQLLAKPIAAQLNEVKRHADPLWAHAATERPALAFPRCQITAVPAQLLAAAVAILDEASEHDEVAAQSLVAICRDLFDYYRARVLGALPGAETSGSPDLHVPTLAVLVHNDCQFLAHHLALLGWLYGPRLAKSSLSTSGAAQLTFLDLAHLFRRQGERLLAYQLTRQQTDLLQALKVPGGFQDASLPDKATAIGRAIRNAVADWERLVSAWRPALPAHLFAVATGRTLLQALLTYVVDEVLDLVDIGVDDSESLHAVLGTLEAALQRFGTVIAALRDRPKRGLATDQEVEAEALHRYVPSARKFRQVHDILQLNMAGIMARLEAGELADFNATELTNLVCALFADSPRRAANLEVIRRRLD
ncbi:Centromere/kinetochore protein zw10 [Tieghemiomyces parasiticus]|uniref:Centromere/kinetochore protein zw10 n=1 Tax=Tieghemiomyces parasiticus TaxID=78921 RepID=A0A9W8DTU7_9FUNG|nr:Centromere/kinetochore protein zw10 [Tieghemiomyces parasiticus]